MSGMTAVLVEWYPACLDRAEQRARLAAAFHPAPWRLEHGSAVDANGDDLGLGYDGLWGDVTGDHAEHIADVDPSWRLADLDLKREIFAEHEPEEVGPGRLRCSVCADPPQYDATWHEWPCRTVRLLAQEFDTEPGYHSEWAP